MSIVMKSRMTAAALAVCSVMGMGYSAGALADGDSVDFTTTINVSSINKCEATVTAGDTGSNWALTWTLDSASGPSSIDYGSAATDPLQVKVTINDDAANDCHLNGMKIAADMGSSVSVAGDSAAFKQPVSNGFWRYMPVVADAKLYTDTTWTTAVDGDVSVKGADAEDYTVQATAQHTAQEQITPAAGWNWGSNEAVVLSNGYLNNGGYAPLTANGAPAPVTFTLGTPAQNVDSAIIGVSAIIASDPEDAAGTTDVNAVVDNEVVNMPFTINVTWL